MSSRNGKNRVAAAAKKSARKSVERLAEPDWLEPLKQAITRRDQLRRTVSELRTQLDQAQAALQRSDGHVDGILDGNGVSAKEAQDALSKAAQ